jgi:hypothetical protein
MRPLSIDSIEWLTFSPLIAQLLTNLGQEAVQDA